MNSSDSPHGVRELVERLSADATLIRAWEQYELSGPAPDQLDFRAIAERIDQAASALTAQDHRLAELTKERDEAARDSIAFQEAYRKKLYAEGLARKIASFPAHEDDRGPDNTVFGDHLPMDPGQELGEWPRSIDRLAAALLSSISGGEGEGFGQTPEQPQCGVGQQADLTDQGGEP